MVSPWKKELHKLIASVKNAAETENLFKALLTPTEHEELARRWQIVKHLIQGVSQREIRDQLSVSIATVTRGARELQHGDGTFRKFYDRLYRQKH